MPTHPECLYYLYKGYTHTHTHTPGVYVRERNQNPLRACMRADGRESYGV